MIDWAAWAGVATIIAVQLVSTGFIYGRLIGRLRLLEYRLGQVEGALRHCGVLFAVTPSDAAL